MTTFAEVPVAARVRSEMVLRGYTTSDLGRTLGVTQPSANRRLLGRTQFKADELITVANWLRIPISKLFEPVPASDVAMASGVALS